MNGKVVLKTVGILSFVVFFAGCLSQLKTREDLRGQTTTSQAPQASQGAVAPTSESTVVEAEPIPAYEQVEKNEEIRRLYGRVEEAENQVRELRESMIELAGSRQKEKEEAAAKLQAYEEAIRNLEAQIESLKAAPQAKAAAPKKEEGKKADPREDYHKGEDFFRQKKWKEAIVSYQKYRETYPKGKFYADATFNIGVCFVQLGLKEESKSFFEEVKVKFPNSPLAKKAEKQLKSL